MQVLIVDDSVVFRSQIKTALSGLDGVEVCGVAQNGRIALQKLAQSSVDVMTLDMEMPEMGGLETIQEARRSGFKTKIIVFSSSTSRGSEATLAALRAGADDFVAKPSGNDLSIETAAAHIKAELVPKIFQFFGNSVPSPTHRRENSNEFPKKDLSHFRPSVILIGSSTGGPPALESVLVGIKNPRVPIVIAQHMPPVFTASLASRLESLTGIPCCEAKSGMRVEAGKIYVAPGNYHAYLRKKASGEVEFYVDQGPLRNSVRPAVDHLFESGSGVYGPGSLAVVLTGMGEDGKAGCLEVKKAGGGVIIQSRETCVVFGMPGAVFEAGLHDRIGSLEEIFASLKAMTN